MATLNKGGDENLIDNSSGKFRAAHPNHGAHPLRRRVYEIIEMGRGEDRASKLFDTFIVTLIVLNILVFMAETVPALEARYAREFFAFEIVSVAVFTLEYLARLWVAVEVPFLSRHTPVQARIAMATRPALIIDLLAILPFYLSHIFAIDLRVLRILRLLRFLKLSRYSPAMHTLIRVLSNERRALMGAGLLLVAAVLFAASGMYYIEHRVQPDKFGTVPDAAWWAIATLTTVGYGDVTPITPFGRFFGGIVMVVGLCILALPVAIISTGFAQEMNRRDFVVNWSLMSRIPMLADLDASAVAAMIPMLQAHNYPPNMQVLEPGSPGNAVYFVASGRIVRRSANDTRAFHTGDVFGTVAMVQGAQHGATYLTESKCRLLKLHREDFLRLEMTHPGITNHIRKLADERHDDMD
ncbi:MAG: ion transporter [Hyphomicrobiaceae bacterium]|nr:ion transporter [Hyphomicrobiaceae bacterium]